MVSVLASSAVDRDFVSRSGQTKDYKIGIWCFSAKRSIEQVNFQLTDDDVGFVLDQHA
jgi:hypothetical protein